MWQKIKNIYHLFQSLLANIYYGFPGRKLNVIAVTGTSGKTTTTLMIYEVLKAAKLKTSVLSSIQAVIGGEEFDTGFHVTTPDPHVLPKYLNQALKNGDTHFVLEVSSHAMDQNRAAFVPFKIGVLTSFAHEHLDYHKTLKNYARAKFKLLHAAENVIIPVNVINEELQREVRFNKLLPKLITFGLKEGNETQEKWNLKIKLPGDFNLLNALAAASVGSKLHISGSVIKYALESFLGIPGRYERITNNKGITIIIDFAHKVDALEALLKSVHSLAKNGNRIICMFGCASERDILKRPIMGKISGLMADITVLTDEDPRYEDPLKIINEISAGCIEAGAEEVSRSGFRAKNYKNHIFFKIPDRQEAINFIIDKLAEKGDIILLCGKGHEKSMNYKGIEQPWSEHKAVKKALTKT